MEFEKKNKTQLHNTETGLVGARGGSRGIRGKSEEAQRVQTSRYKINKSWGWNVQHDYYITVVLNILC